MVVAKNRLHSRSAPPYLLVVFASCASCFILIVSAMMLGQFVSTSSNPYAAFADVFPGQPRGAAQAQGFLCLISAYGAPAYEYCTVDLPRGIISQIDVSIDEDLIDEISFRLRDDTLRVGDLMLFWGEPTVTTYSRSVYLHWRGRGIFALVTEYSGRFSLQLPVRRISVGDTAGLLILQ